MRKRRRSRIAMSWKGETKRKMRIRNCISLITTLFEWQSTFGISTFSRWLHSEWRIQCRCRLPLALPSFSPSKSLSIDRYSTSLYSSINTFLHSSMHIARASTASLVTHLRPLRLATTSNRLFAFERSEKVIITVNEQCWFLLKILYYSSNNIFKWVLLLCLSFSFTYSPSYIVQAAHFSPFPEYTPSFISATSIVVNVCSKFHHLIFALIIWINFHFNM